MAKFIKILGIVFIAISIASIAVGLLVGLFSLCLKGTPEEWQYALVFTASGVSVLIFAALIYAAGAALQALEAIQANVSNIYKEMKSEYYEEKHYRLYTDQSDIAQDSQRNVDYGSNNEISETPIGANNNEETTKAAVGVERKTSVSEENEDNSTMWKCHNCGTLNPKQYYYCYKCGEYRKK